MNGKNHARLANVNRNRKSRSARKTKRQSSRVNRSKIANLKSRKNLNRKIIVKKWEWKGVIRRNRTRTMVPRNVVIVSAQWEATLP